MKRIRAAAPYIALVAVLAVSYSVVVDTLGNVYLSADLAAGGCLAIAMMGLVLQLAGPHQFSLGQGGFLAMGAYGSSIGMTKFGLPPVTSVVLAVVATALFAWPVGRILNRLNELYFTVATLAFTLITTSVVHQLSDTTGGEDGLSVPPLTIGAWTLEDPLHKYWIAWGTALVCAIGVSSFLVSRRGRALRAVGGDDHAARALGVPSATLRTQAFVVSAALGALGGALLAVVTGFIHPGEFGVQAAIGLLVVVVVGFARPCPTLVAALVIAMLPAVFESLQTHLELIYGLTLVIVLVATSQGWSVPRPRFGRSTARSNERIRV